MKYLIPVLLLLFTACSAPGQKKSDPQTPQLTDEQIIKKYLENGAWTVRYFSPEYQVYLDSAIAQKPGMAYLYQQKAMPYFKQGKYELGLKYLDKAVELDSKAHIDYRAFIRCIFANTYEEAIRDFQMAKKIKGENGIVMDHSYDFYLGLCYLQLGDFSASLTYLESSIEMARKRSGEDWIHPLDLFYAGIAMQELSRHTEAIAYFDKALKAYPAFSDAKYYKSVSLFRTGETEQAERMLTDCERDFKKGFTVSDENSIYETYPYQIKQFHIDLLRFTKK